MYLSAQADFDRVLLGTAPNGSAPPLLNPLAPMAFFPPALSFDLTVAAYVLVATLSVMIWDILHTISADYTLLTKYKIGIPTIVYFISRLSTLGWILTTTIFNTAPVGNCQMWAKSIMWTCNIAVPSSSLLFFFRVRPLYKGNKTVVAFFLLVWLGVCGAGVISTRGLSGSTVGPTQYCVSSTVPRFAYLLGVAVLVNDTVNLLATSWRLLNYTNMDDKKPFLQRLRNIVLGSNLPTFSRAFLHDGQKYYLTTVGFALLVTITLYLDVVPAPIRGAVGTPDIMLLNIMACRVFRNTRFGIYREGTEATMSRVAREIGITPNTSIAVNDNSTSNLVYPRAPTPCLDVVRGVQPHVLISHHNDSQEKDSSIIPSSYPFHYQPNPTLRTMWYE